MGKVTLDLTVLDAFDDENTDLESAPPTSAGATKEELVSYLKQMYTMRRMEITCDTEYKVDSTYNYIANNMKPSD